MTNTFLTVQFHLWIYSNPFLHTNLLLH